MAVFSEYSRPEVKFVRAGTLDDPSWVRPDVHIYTRSKVGWLTLSESVPDFEVYYDRKTLLVGRQPEATRSDPGKRLGRHAFPSDEAPASNGSAGAPSVRLERRPDLLQARPRLVAHGSGSASISIRAFAITAPAAIRANHLR